MRGINRLNEIRGEKRFQNNKTQWKCSNDKLNFNKTTFTSPFTSPSSYRYFFSSSYSLNKKSSLPFSFSDNSNSNNNNNNQNFEEDFEEAPAQAVNKFKKYQNNNQPFAPDIQLVSKSYIIPTIKLNSRHLSTLPTCLIEEMKQIIKKAPLFYKNVPIVLDSADVQKLVCYFDYFDYYLIIYIYYYCFYYSLICNYF